jgi:hypothetical protein
MVRLIVKLALALVLAVVVFCVGWLIGRTGIGSVMNPASLPDLERQFIARMTNVTMVGTFTVDGRERRNPEPDRYDIAGVQKVGENLWQFNTKMECCGMEGKGVAPIVVPMRFYGDTPMIEMTDTSLPGIGTFTVRVFFYGDRYAGTWQHGNVGGHMSGRIEKTAEPIK